MASPIEEMIDEIEEYVETCKPIALSNTMIKVNRDDMQSLLEELRAKTPPEIARYQKIISNEKQILDNAKRQADTILAEAQINKDKLVSEHEIMQQAYNQANEVVMEATKRAQELLDRATNEANDIRSGAIAYTDNLLKRVQEVMVHSMDTTRQRQDQYLNEMQQYLDEVVGNRMQLSPSPEEMVVNSPSPAQRIANNDAEKEKKVQKKVEKKPVEDEKAIPQQEQKQVDDKKVDSEDEEANATGNIRNMSNKFFKQD